MAVTTLDTCRACPSGEYIADAADDPIVSGGCDLLTRPCCGNRYEPDRQEWLRRIGTGGVNWCPAGHGEGAEPVEVPRDATPTVAPPPIEDRWSEFAIAVNALIRVCARRTANPCVHALGPFACAAHGVDQVARLCVPGGPCTDGTCKLRKPAIGGTPAGGGVRAAAADDAAARAVAAAGG